MRNQNRVILKDSGEVYSIVNELDKISTILLPPEDTPDNMMQHSAKRNPYFVIPKDNIHYNNYESMLNNYQRVANNDTNRILSDRDMLSSQYSSVASTIVDKPNGRRLSNDHKSINNVNRNFIIRNVSNKKKSGRRVFPKDFFSN